MSDQVWWYATRAAGLMTWSTAVAAVIIGLLLSTRVVKHRTGPWLLDLHRFLGGISVLFLIVHMGTLYFDSFVDFGPRELFIPGESTWNTEAAAWGIIAAFTLVLVEVTSLLRKWVSPTVWRMFHMMSIVTVAAGSYHAWLGGSDVDNPLTWIIAGAGSVIVVLLVGVRLRRAGNEDHMTADRSSREALLREMRQRLEGLPIPDTATEAELDVEGAPTLPRRTAGASPFDEAPLLPGQVDIPEPSAVPAPPSAPPAPVATNDVFAAVPLADEAPDLGNWVAPEPASPFDRAPVDPFGTSAEASTLPAQPPETDFAFGQQAPDPFLRGDDAPPPIAAFEPGPADEPFTPDAPSPFGEPAPAFDPASPFGSEVPSSPVPDPDPFTPVADPMAHQPDPLPPVAEAPAMPTPARADEPAPTANPFSPAEPTPQAFSVEVPAAEAPAPAAAPGPPPLPDSAIDPATGEPDQAAYQAWLIEWLAFAEKYGEETPDDPTRV